MNERRLVLDTNAFRGLRRREVENLADRGFTFIVSEIALSEALAASVREFEAGRPRDRARGLFFKRAKLFARYVDPEYPVAVAGGHAIERIRNTITGVFDGDSENAKHAEQLRQVWRVLVGIELLDEEWISAGHEAERWLAHLDAELQSLARREAELWNGVPDEIAEKRAGWLALSEEERLGHLREYLLRTWAFDEAMTDRVLSGSSGEVELHRLDHLARPLVHVRPIRSLFATSHVVEEPTDPPHRKVAKLGTRSEDQLGELIGPGADEVILFQIEAV